MAKLTAPSSTGQSGLTYNGTTISGLGTGSALTGGRTFPTARDDTDTTFDDGDYVTVVVRETAVPADYALLLCTYQSGAATLTKVATFASEGTISSGAGDVEAYVVSDRLCEIEIACSDETTALAAGDAKATFRMPYAMYLVELRASVTTAPTTQDIVIAIRQGGTDIMTTTFLNIDFSETTSTTSDTTPNITTKELTDDAEIKIDIDQVGSGTTGAGLKVTFLGVRR